MLEKAQLEYHHLQQELVQKAAEVDRLKSTHDKTCMERDHWEAGHDHVAAERDELNASVAQLSAERDDWKSKYEAIAAEFAPQFQSLQQPPQSPQPPQPSSPSVNVRTSVTRENTPSALPTRPAPLTKESSSGGLVPTPLVMSDDALSHFSVKKSFWEQQAKTTPKK